MPALRRLRRWSPARSNSGGSGWRRIDARGRRDRRRSGTERMGRSVGLIRMRDHCGFRIADCGLKIHELMNARCQNTLAGGWMVRRAEAHAPTRSHLARRIVPRLVQAICSRDIAAGHSPALRSFQFYFVILSKPTFAADHRPAIPSLVDCHARCAGPSFPQLNPF